MPTKEFEKQRYSAERMADLLVLLARENMTAVQLADHLNCTVRTVAKLCELLNEQGIIYIDRWVIETTARMNHLVPMYATDLQLIHVNAPKP